MSPAQAHLLEELRHRRRSLAERAALRSTKDVTDLLRQVDDALARFDHEEWGTCSVCREPIEGQRLAADPLATVCLDCLSPTERRELERDLASANRIQRTFLPATELRHGGWLAAWIWEPLGSVSGDHVDLVAPRHGEGPVHLLIGDVVGKGVAASLLQSQLHALFRVLLESPGGLGRTLSRANRLFYRATGDRSYATLVAARLDPDGSLELANAGHPRPLLADHRGVRPVEGAGVPLGMFEEAEYAPHKMRLSPEDTLLFYTDGWTEAARRGAEYGVGRGAAALRKARRLPPAELLAACRDDMERFLAGAARVDDLTLLALRRSRRPTELENPGAVAP